MSSEWNSPIKLEFKVADIISQQAKHGCNFKKSRAAFLVHRLNEQILNIDLKLVPMLPPMFNKGSTYNKPFKLNGQFQKWPGIYAESQGITKEEVCGPFTAVWYSPFDPGKTSRLKEVMLDHGWMPTEWNEKKMPFQLWQYRKRLSKTSYDKFIKDCMPEEREFYTTYINGFIDAHFKNKSVGYMKAILNAIGFVGNKTPSFGQIKKKLLLKQYWPTSPKITEDSLEDMGEGSESLKLLLDRMQLSHRRSLLEGLIKVTRSDGKISGEAASCATPTARMKHRKIVNIPAARALLGKELRGLFIGDYREGAKPKVLHKPIKANMRRIPLTNLLEEYDEKKGKWKPAGSYRIYIPSNYDSFVGGDGAALELRMLAHYLVSISQYLLDEAIKENNAKNIKKYQSALTSAEEYKHQILEGDIHTHNQMLAGLPTRDAAKTFIYAFLYGAGNGKLGVLVGGGVEEGEIMRQRFLDQCPCIPVLIEWVQSFAVTGGLFKGVKYRPGTIPAIDGRPLMMRLDPHSGEVMTHKALNTLLQAAGSIVMKVGMCFLDAWVKKAGIDCHQVIMMHRKSRCASKIV